MMPGDRLSVRGGCVTPFTKAAPCRSDSVWRTAVWMQPGMLTWRDLWRCPVEMS